MDLLRKKGVFTTKSTESPTSLKELNKLAAALASIFNRRDAENAEIAEASNVIPRTQQVSRCSFFAAQKSGRQ